MNLRYFPMMIEEVVEDMIADMNESVKADIVNTSEEGLSAFYHGLATHIRNTYGLCQNQNPALMRTIGAEHPDDASMLILKAVRKALLETGETYYKGKIEETDSLTWDVQRNCLEISADGRSLVISGITVEFARVLADALRVRFSEHGMYVAEDAEPRMLLYGMAAQINVWTYPGHPSNRRKKQRLI